MFVFKNSDEKIPDNVEVYVKYSGTGEKAVIDLKEPLVGVSGFEVLSVEISNYIYNLPNSQFIQFSTGDVMFPEGSYTSITFVAKLQEVLNSVSSSPYTVVYNIMTKKITISNTEPFLIFSPGTWSPSFRSLIGFTYSIPGSPIELGPFTEYTFEFPSNDNSVSKLNVLVKILTDLTAHLNTTIGAQGLLDLYTQKIPIVAQKGFQNNFDKSVNNIIKFKSKYNVNSLDISLFDEVLNANVNIPWSATLIFYF